MSAVLGGTDSLTVNPYDSAIRDPGEFSERIARNQQLILKYESYFDKVADPSAGSYYIENLTALVAENAWKLFLEIEKMGGFLAVIKSGFLQRKISASAENRKYKIKRRKEILTGINRFSDPDEKPPVNQGEGTDRNDMPEEPEVEQIKPFRASEGFEKIRAALWRVDKRPSVFLLKIGDQHMRKARALFSSAFFGCAGYHIVENDGFSSVDEAVKAAMGSGSEIVVICSSDKEYPVYAPAINDRLKEKAVVVIAGNPEKIENLRSAGLKNYIHVKSDMVESLEYYNSVVGL